MTRVGDYAFWCFDNLTSVTFPDSLVSIGLYAFENCRELLPVVFPQGLESIGQAAFCSCASLTRIIIPDSVSRIGTRAFAFCSAEEIVIPESVTFLGDAAFEACVNLSQVTFLGDAPSIGSDAFRDITATVYYPAENDTWTEDVMQDYGGNLTWVPVETSLKITSGTCGENLTWVLTDDGTLTISGEGEMDDYGSSDSNRSPWYDYQDQIVKAVIKEGVTRVGKSAFWFFDNLTSVTFPDSLVSIGSYAFSSCDKLSNVVFPQGLEEIELHAFYGCDSITSVTIPASVTSIGSKAFRYCSNLTGIWVEEGNQNYSSDGRGVLFNHDKTELIQAPGAINGSYVIPDTVQCIGEGAFWFCDELTEVTLPSTLTRIESFAFSSCYNLVGINLPDGLLEIGYSAFSNCRSLTSVIIPASVTSIGEEPFPKCTSLTKIEVDENNPCYTSDADGVLYNREMTHLIQAPGALTGTYSIPQGVTTIGGSAFEGCKKLTHVTIPDGVSAIEDYTFYYCEGLTEVSLPDGLSSIGYAAFGQCDALVEIAIPETVTSLGNHAFIGCRNLSTVTFLGDAPSIGEHAFYHVTAAVYYPTENDTWTEDVRQDYGGNLTWVPVVPPLKITSQPEDYVGALNSYATFTVAVNLKNVTYQWYFSSDNGATWKHSSSEGYNTNTLRVQIKEYRLGQSYRCEITDSAGNVVTSNGATMGIPESTIEIVTQPTDFTGAATETVEFTVEATGEGLTYRWYYSNNGGESWAASYSDGYDTETVKPVLRAYNTGRLFKCLITDVNGNTAWTDAVCMTIASSEITILSQPVSYTGALNDLATFTVEAEGTNLSYLWYFSTDGGETWQQSYNEGYTTNALNVRLYAYRSGYQYKCIISSGVDIAVETDVVTISKKPSTATILSQPLNAGGEVGTNVTFHVDATGTDLTYQWQFSNNGGESWGSTTAQGSTTDTLTVEVKAYRDGYLYRCVVTDDSGSTVASQPATLRVGIMPVIIRQPESYTGAADTTATFTVEATGENLTYQWQYSNNGGETWSDSGATGADTPSLEVPALAYRNGQMYRCVITNEFGSVISQEATLTVK